MRELRLTVILVIGTILLSSPIILNYSYYPTSSNIVAGEGGGSIGNTLTDVDNISFRWGLEKIEAPQAWEITQGSEKVTVAIIDSGIDHTHKALKGRMWVNKDEIPGNGKDDDQNGYIDDIHGWDFRDNDNSSVEGSPLHWHGTFVAGLVGATIDKSGISGVAPQVKIMDIRFLNSKNRFYGSDWDKFVKSIDYAADNGADVINLSIYANGKPPHRLKRAIERAVRKNIVVVGIAGNNSSAVQYPGKYNSVIAVTATNESDRVASFSNFGPEVAVAASGNRVVSTTPDGKYSRGNGTSFAAPHVSGLIGLLLSVDSTMEVEEIDQILKGSSQDLDDGGRDNKYGYGLINAKRALGIIGGSEPQDTNSDQPKRKITSPIGNTSKSPQDLNNDGLYEDVNGDGEVTKKDLALLGFNLEVIKKSGDWEDFDFNQDGNFDFEDIVRLKSTAENH